MNRRRKKRQQQDPLESVKQRLQSFDWRSKLVSTKQRIEPLWTRLPLLHRRVLMVLVPLVVVLLLLPSGSKDASETVVMPAASRMEIPINTQSLSTREQATAEQAVEPAWQDYTVKQGDTLAAVFRNQGFPMADLNALVKIEGEDQPLSRLRQGQLVRFKRTPEGELDIIQLDSSKGAVIFFRLSDGGFGRSK
ncbi:LysM-like peptidoglycan-binding domain-containing protein [Vibrio astriarenae]|uniref:LysM-like peptidoglycan-binding domain-containing protein n=1 Tax=Vibrio astriarenae TaxID=1481923 RepID=UPI00373615E2